MPAPGGAIGRVARLMFGDLPSLPTLIGRVVICGSTL